MSVKARGNKYQVRLRTTKGEVNATFDDEETAKLFEWYKITTMEDMEKFNVPPQNLIRLKDAFEMKMKSLDNTKASYRKEIISYGLASNAWSDFLGQEYYLHNLTTEKIGEFVDHLVGTTVRYGGSKDERTGIRRVISPATIRQRLAYFSSAISYVIRQGYPLENPFLSYLPQFNQKYMVKQ